MRRATAKTAELIPFPGGRRRGFARKQAARMATMSREKSEAYLHQQLAIQGDVMRRSGNTNVGGYVGGNMGGGYQGGVSAGFRF
jgi:hypothetical protein